MSTTIDEKVVEMRFNSQEFEKRAKSSITLLDRLKKSLDLNGSANNLKKLQNAADRFDMGALGRSVDLIASRFSNMGLIGVTALQNITNRAISTGEQIVKSLTIDPIKTGFQEYETQIGSIQTILANTQSKGTTLDNVTAALDELNKYADQTIYNFTEMTRNIGTFTAAGVDLDKSVTSIKGIANLAAISGSTSQQASTAMYQLSQALAAGKVSLMDWNSVVNAGMGGEVFQTALKRTARQMGYNVDEIIAKYGSFRESLTEGEWLTTEVLTETLTQLSGAYTEADLIAQGYTESQAKEIMALAQTAVNAATKVKTFTQLIDTTKEAVQSGWTQTWEYIIGDFNEAQELLTGVSNVLNGYIQQSSDARNEALKTWKSLGGRDVLIESLGNAFEALLSVMRPIKEAFRDIFPAKTGYDLYAMTYALKNLTAAMIVGEDTAQKIKNTFEGFFAILDLYTSFSWVLLEGGIKAVSSILGLTSTNVLDLTSRIGEVVVKFSDWVYENEIFEKASTGVSKVILFLVNRLKDFVNWIQQLDAYENVVDWLRDFYNDLKAIINSNPKGFEDIVNSLKNLDKLSLSDVGELIRNFADVAKSSLSTAGDAFDTVRERIYSFVDGVKSKFEGIDLGTIVAATLAASMFATLYSVIKLTSALTAVVGNAAQVVGNAAQVLTDTSDTLKAIKKSFQADSFVKMATGVALIAASIAVLSLLDTRDMLIASGVIVVVMGMMIGLYALIQLIDKKAAGVSGQIGKVSTTLLSMSAALFVIVGALKMLDGLNMDGIWERVAILGVIAAGLTVVIIAISKMAPNAALSSTALIGISVSMFLLTKVLESISDMHVTDALKGIVGLTAAVLALGYLLQHMGGIKVSTGAGLALAVGSLYLFINLIEKIADTDTSKILSNLDSYLVILGSFAAIMLASKFAGNNAAKAGVGILAMSAALNLIVVAFRMIDELDPQTVRRGTDVVSDILFMFGLLTAATALSGSNATKAGTAILLMAGALDAIAVAMRVIGAMEASEATQALSAVQQLMTMFGIIVAITAIAKDAAKTMGVIGGVLVALSGMMIVTTLIDPDKVKNASDAISNIMIALGIAVAATSIAKSSITTMIAISAAVGVMGAVLYLLGDLPIESSIGTAASMGILLGAISVSLGILGKIPFTTYLTGMGYLLGIFIVMGLVYAVAAEIAQGVDDQKLADGVELLDTIASSIGSFVGNLISGFGKGLTDNLKAIGENLSAFAEAGKPFFDMLPSISSSTATGAAELAKAMLAITAADFIDSLNNLLTLDLFGKESTVDKFVGDLGTLATGLIDFSNEVAGKIKMESFETAAEAATQMAEFASGISNTGGLLATVIGDNTMASFGVDLKRFAEPFIDFAEVIGEATINTAAVENAATAASVMVEVANGLSNTGGAFGLIFGNNDIDTFGEQLRSFADPFVEFATTIGNASIDQSAVESAANATKAMAEVANNLPNTNGEFAYWFGGNMDLSSFGWDLKSFGSSIVEFAQTIQSGNINERAVSAAANIVDVFAEIASGLDKYGGLTGAIEGEQDLSIFGDQLARLGGSIQEFYVSFDSIDIDRLNEAATQFGRIVSFASTANSLEGYALTNFANQLSHLAKMGVSEFVNEFDTAHDDAQTAIRNFLNAAKNEMASESVNMIADGSIANSIIDSFSGKTEAMKSSVSALMSAGVTQIEMYYASYKYKAGELAGEIRNAFEEKQTLLKNTMGKILDGMLSKIREYNDDFETAGRNAADGFVRGVQGHESDIYAASEEMAAAVDNGIRDRLDIHSPSKLTNLLGKFVGSGFVGGLKDNFGAVYDSATAMGDNVTDGLSDALGVSSDTASGGISSVGYSTGSSVSSGIASGITSNKSPEEAAADKAQAIADAFQDALDDIDLSSTTVDLQYQLWEKTTGVSLNESQLAVAELEQLNKELGFQQQRVEIAQKIYDQTVDALGEGSDEAREKYNSLLQEMVTLADLTQQINETKTSAAEKNAEAYQAYIDELNANRDYYLGLLEQGFTSEQIHQAIQQYVGYDPNFKLDTSVYENATTDMMNALSAASSSGVTDTTAASTANFQSIGASYAMSLATGFQTKTGTLVDQVKNAGKLCLDALTAMGSDWKSAGASLAEQMVSGMIEAVNQARNSFAFNSSGGLIGTVVSAAASSPAWWDDAIDGSGGSSTPISSSVNTAAVLKQTGMIDKIVNVGISAATSAAAVAATASRMSDFASYTATGAQPPVTTYQFTQNNYSPKSLSRIEIYRQTQNQLSTLKGMVTK